MPYHKFSAAVTLTNKVPSREQKMEQLASGSTAILFLRKMFHPKTLSVLEKDLNSTGCPYFKQLSHFFARGLLLAHQ